MRFRGFTMVELILVILLMALVAAMSVPIIVAGFQSFFQEQRTTDIERQAMLALERITREIRLGTDIVVAGSTVTFNRGGASTTVGYDGAGQLYMSRGGGANQPLAGSVTGANFSEESYEDARYIRVSFGVAGSSQSWRSTIYPRNDQ